MTWHLRRLQRRAAQTRSPLEGDRVDHERSKYSLEHERLVEAAFESMLELGQDATNLASHHPELYAEVLRRLSQLRAVEADVELLFPKPLRPDVRRASSTLDSSKMPSIDGYAVEGILGRGGMGVVYKAHHEKLKRPVAIKMLLAGSHASAQEISRFQREAEAVARLQHPNIVQIFDIGEVDGIPYYTMEFVEGGTLAERIRTTPLPIRDITLLMVTLSKTAQVAHERGVIHRDLKPANILLTQDGVAKISDFGLASQLDVEWTFTGNQMGTPCYMAPEQIQPSISRITSATDVYALGGILYEMLSGQPPLPIHTMAEAERWVSDRRPTPRFSSALRVPRDLETICFKCLQRDPDRRYASANELAADLELYRTGQPIHARPIGRMERGWRWVRREPSNAALVFSAILLACMGMIVSLREWRVASWQQAEIDRWKARLAFVVDMEREGRFKEARAAILHVPEGQSDLLREEIARARANLDMVERFDAIRMRRGTFTEGGSIDYESTSLQYESAFRAAGFGSPGDNVGQVAAQIGESPVRAIILAALDDWAIGASETTRRWVLDVARATDPHPWRNRVRDPDRWSDVKHIEELAKTAEVEREPLTLLVSLGARWRLLGGDPLEFLRTVQRNHPDDFWLNFELGYLYGMVDTREAVGYSRAALALRPNATVVHYNLGIYHSMLGDEEIALQHFEQVLAIDSQNSYAHSQISRSYASRGDFERAETHCRRALQLTPDDFWSRSSLRFLKLRQGQFEAAREMWRHDLQRHYETHDDWDGYAELCLFLGKEAEYHWACDELLKRFGGETNPTICERTGRACLLHPRDQEQLTAAVALIDRALSADTSTFDDWLFAYFQLAKALAELREGQFEKCVILLHGEAGGVLPPVPNLLRAIAEYRLGHQTRAKEALQDALASFDWSQQKAVDRESWIFHHLRREAESLLVEGTRPVSTANAQ